MLPLDIIGRTSKSVTDFAVAKNRTLMPTANAGLSPQDLDSLGV